MVNTGSPCGVGFLLVRAVVYLDGPSAEKWNRKCDFFLVEMEMTSIKNTRAKKKLIYLASVCLPAVVVF